MYKEIRTLTKADFPAYSEVAGYSFNFPPEEVMKILDKTTRSGDGTAGIFADGRLAAALIDRRFGVNVNGAFVTANGIGMVASSPETRRRGLVRDMLAWHLEQLKQEGVVLSLLYPFNFRFYNRMGWGFASRLLQATIPVQEFTGYGRDVGRMRRLMTCDKNGLYPEPGMTKEQVIEAINGVFARAASIYNLAALREPRDWDRVLSVDESRRYVYVWESPEGRVEGYYAGMTRGDEYPNQLRVRDLWACTPDAWRGLFWFLSGHGAHIKNVRLMLPPAHQLIEVLTNPRIEGKLEHGPMARAVDVTSLLQSRGTAGLVPGRCVIRVIDELAAWNDGRFAVAFDGSAVQATKLADAGDADLTAPVDVFTQLSVGLRSVDDMIRFGLIQTTPGHGLEFARALFPARPIWHPEYY